MDTTTQIVHRLFYIGVGKASPETSKRITNYESRKSAATSKRQNEREIFPRALLFRRLDFLTFRLLAPARRRPWCK